MAIKYAIVMRKNNRTGRVLAYANPVNELCTYDQLVNAIVEATTVTRADAAAVIEALVVYTKQELLRGNAVALGQLGALYTTFRSAGTADAKEFTASLIKRVNIRFRPTEDFSTTSSWQTSRRPSPRPAQSPSSRPARTSASTPSTPPAKAEKDKEKPKRPTPDPAHSLRPTPDPATVASGDLLPFVGPKPHSVASLKTPVAPREGRREGERNCK